MTCRGHEAVGPSYTPSGVAHFFTVDVEDYFQAGIFERQFSRAAWEKLEPRVERNVDRLLGLLDAAGATATFFTLGWTAERHGPLVRRIAGQGHEIASRGMWRRRVPELTITEFRDDVRASKQALEDAAGTPVVGFRAPDFSLLPGVEWAFDVLGEEGYEYDSSRFPAQRAAAGAASAVGAPHTPRYPHAVSTTSGHVIEVPLTMVDVAGVPIDAAGGARLRNAPFALVRAAFRRCARAGMPGVLHVRPWELDWDMPRAGMPLGARAWHCAGFRRTEPRLARLLGEFRFRAIAEALPSLGAGAPVVYV